MSYKPLSKASTMYMTKNIKETAFGTRLPSYPVHLHFKSIISTQNIVRALQDITKEVPQSIFAINKKVLTIHHISKIMLALVVNLHWLLKRMAVLQLL